MNSPKEEHLSKAVLNITTYNNDEPDPDPRYETIDITELLKERGITSICSVHGLWSLGGPYVPGYDEEMVVEYAVTGEELRHLCKEVCDTLDLAIVNDKQNKALKKLIEDKFKEFEEEHYEPIGLCHDTRQCIETLIDKEIAKNS